ncbi:MAG: hypothetical protein FWG68_01605 [Defluviitaleaceae bacterium]|nr:hypothetical protein [Defluviitaleaceae bacterium]
MKKEFDFSKAIRNPYYGKLIKDDKYVVRIEYKDRDEIREINIKTKEEKILEVFPKNVPITQPEENLAYN